MTTTHPTTSVSRAPWYAAAGVLASIVALNVSESLANAAKHAVGPIRVSLSESDGQLQFVIADSGPGFDPDVVARGAGLDNLFDRLDALDGTLTIDSTPGDHTTITGTIPVSVVV